MTLLRLPKVRAIHHHAAMVKVKRVKFGSELITIIHNIKWGEIFFNTELMLSSRQVPVAV